MYNSARSRLAFIVVNLVFCITILELLTVASSWKITRKCPYGHYYNDGCVTCWCDTNTGHTNCQRSSLCNRVNVKCQNGKVYKDECGNSCNCHEDTGAVFCSNSNPQCQKMKLSTNKEDLENMKSTTSKPIIPKIHVPALPQGKSKYEVYQPLILRRSTVMKKPPPLYDMDYNSGGTTVISLYEKIRRLMSKKIKETIDDVIQDELRKPLNHIFARPVAENSNAGVIYAGENVRPLSTSHFSHKKPVPETIEDEVPKSGFSNIHEVFAKAPSETPEEAKKSPLNYRERSDDLKESYVREPLLGSEGSESQKVLTFSHPSRGTIRPILSNFEDRIKPNSGSSFHNTSPKPFSYNTFQVNTLPSFTYEESTPKAVSMNFSERTPTRTPSFTFEKSTPRFTLAEEVHQSTSQPRIYNVILSTPRPYLYDNQSNSSKPIIREFVQSTTPQYSNYQYSTARRAFLESVLVGSTPRPNYYPSTLQPSIYDFEGHSHKHNSFDKSYQRQNHLQPSYIHGSSTPISTLYDFPQSTPKPLYANFNHATPTKTMQHSFHQNSPKPIIRLIFQQSTSKPPSFIVRNHNGRFSTNKPGNSNYLRTTSIADPSRFIFHQMTTKRPTPAMRLHPNTPPLYTPYHHNYNSPKPTFTNVSPVYSSPNMNVNKGSSFVYIFHETKPRENIPSSIMPQNNNNFHRQPLLQNPSTTVRQYVSSPTRVPINFVRNTLRPMTKPTSGTKHFVSNSHPIFEMSSLGNPVTPAYNFEHLMSPKPIAHRLEDEIPKPTNFDFQEDTPEYVNFNVNYNSPTMSSNANTQTRKPVVLKYKNWASEASTTIPTTRRPNPATAATTRRPKIKTVKEPVDFTYPPPTRANSAPAIKIHNHGTRTDNIEHDYNSHKIDSSNTPINYSNSNEGVSASSISPMLNYDYGRAETITKSSSPEREEEINHEEMIPKELILDPNSGPMTVIFDHDNGQESLKFSDRKGHEPIITFSQDNPENPIEVDVETTSAKSTTVDLEEILQKEPEEEYQPVFVDLEKDEKKTPIVTIKSESGNKNVQEYIQQSSNLREPITYYGNQEKFGDKQAQEPYDVHLAVTPSDIVTYEEEHFDHVKENYDNVNSNEKRFSDIGDKEESNDRRESMDYESENQQEPSTFVTPEDQPQETLVINDYEQEQPKEFNEEESNPQLERITPTYGYNNENGRNEQSYYTQQEVIRDSTAEMEVNVTPINFDFPNHDAETTPATQMYDDQGESSYGYATENIHQKEMNKHQFMHKSGEELLSELPLVESKGEILRFKFSKDEKINKKPLLVSFKKQGRPYRASAYLKTDAVADVFSFYHKMRQESAKRAVAAAERRRLDIPSDDSSQDDYFNSNHHRTSNKRSQSTSDDTKKVSRRTDADENSNKRIHSGGFADALKRESTSNEPRDRHHLSKDMADKLDWKLEIEV